MKKKNILKIGLPLIGVTALSIALPLTLTSCSDSKESKPINLEKNLSSTTKIAKNQNLFQVYVDANSNNNQELAYQWYYKTNNSDKAQLSSDNSEDEYVPFDNDTITTAQTNRLVIIGDVNQLNGLDIKCKIYEKNNPDVFVWSENTHVNLDESLPEVQISQVDVSKSTNLEAIGNLLNSENLKNSANIDDKGHIVENSQLYSSLVSMLGFNSNEEANKEIKSIKLSDSQSVDEYVDVDMNIMLEDGWSWSTSVYQSLFDSTTTYANENKLDIDLNDDNSITLMDVETSIFNENYANKPNITCLSFDLQTKNQGFNLQQTVNTKSNIQIENIDQLNDEIILQYSLEYWNGSEWAKENSFTIVDGESDSIKNISFDLEHKIADIAKYRLVAEIVNTANNNQLLSSCTSKELELNVNLPDVKFNEGFNLQPITYYSNDDTSVNLNVLASDANYASQINYQWYVVANSKDSEGTKIEGATSSQLTISEEDFTKGNQYYCEAYVTGFENSKVRSKVTSLEQTKVEINKVAEKVNNNISDSKGLETVFEESFSDETKIKNFFKTNNDLGISESDIQEASAEVITEKSPTGYQQIKLNLTLNNSETVRDGSTSQQTLFINSNQYVTEITENLKVDKNGVITGFSTKVLGTDKEKESKQISLNIPNYPCLTGIGKNAFAIDDGDIKTDIQNTTNVELLSINIPSSIKYIGLNAFYNQPNLTSVTFDSNSTLEAIAKDAFYNCGFTTIKLPNTINTLAERVFATCKKLQSFSFNGKLTAEFKTNNVTKDDENPMKDWGFANANTIPKQMFSKCSSLREVHLPDSIQSIENSAFFGTSSLKKITWPKELKTIGWTAFRETGLEVVDLSNTKLVDVVYAAFMGSKDLKTVKMPTTYKKLVTDSFSECSSLENVYLPTTEQLEGYDEPTAASKTGWQSIFHNSNLANLTVHVATEENAEFLSTKLKEGEEKWHQINGYTPAYIIVDANISSYNNTFFNVYSKQF